MRAVVGVKRCVDYLVKVRVSGGRVQTANVKHSMNPFCEIAVQEALNLKKAGVVSEIVAVSVGPAASKEVVTRALAMGADRGVHVVHEPTADMELQPMDVARVLQKVVEKEEAQLVVLGKQAIDDDCNHTGQMLAGLLDWPQGTFAYKVSVDAGAKRVEVVREVDGGLETVSLALPAVVTADLRLNEPALPGLPAIMKAKKKPMESLKPADLGIDVQPRIEIVTVEEPPQRSAGIKVADVKELVEKIKPIVTGS